MLIVSQINGSVRNSFLLSNESELYKASYSFLLATPLSDTDVPTPTLLPFPSLVVRLLKYKDPYSRLLHVSRTLIFYRANT